MSLPPIESYAPLMLAELERPVRFEEEPPAVPLPGVRVGAREVRVRG